MNKVELVEKVASEFGMTKAEAEKCAMFVLESCFQAALTDGKVRVGSHRFERVERARRKGRNPQTGEEIEIPARTKVTYRNLSL